MEVAGNKVHKEGGKTQPTGGDGGITIPGGKCLQLGSVHPLLFGLELNTEKSLQLI